MWSHQAPAQYSMLNSGVLILTEFSEEKLEAGGAEREVRLRPVDARRLRPTLVGGPRKW